jgi:hypothetical protein
MRYEGAMADSPSLPPRLAAHLHDMPLEELAFSPVPVKPRRDGWTLERQIGFIHRLALIGCVSAAAQGVGKSRESAYRLRQRPGAESFAAAWDKAQGWGRSVVLDLAIQRAIEGEVRPVYYRGRKIDDRVRYDNRLLIATLRTLPDPTAVDNPSETFQRLLDEIDPDGAGSR